MSSSWERKRTTELERRDWYFMGKRRRFWIADQLGLNWVLLLWLLILILSGGKEKKRRHCFDLSWLHTWLLIIMNLISSTGSYPPRPLPLEEKFQIAIQILLDGAKFLFIYNFIRKKKRINFQRGLLAGGQYFHNQWRFRHFTISRGG